VGSSPSDAASKSSSANADPPSWRGNAFAAFCNAALSRPAVTQGPRAKNPYRYTLTDDPLDQKPKL